MTNEKTQANDILVDGRVKFSFFCFRKKKLKCYILRLSGDLSGECDGERLLMLVTGFFESLVSLRPLYNDGRSLA